MVESLLAESESPDSIRVLHVDDDPQFGGLVAEFLSHFDDGLCVVTETTVEDAWPHLEAGTVDCIVSDYEMPKTDGIEFLRDVRAEYPNLPFILFTGKGSEGVAGEAISAGVTDYLQKQEDTSIYELLANRIRRAVSRTRAERRAKLASDQLQALFDQIDGFYAVDDDWTVTYWNDRMASRTGTDPRTVIGADLFEAHEFIVDTDVEEALRETMDSGTPTSVEAFIDATNHWVAVHAYPVQGGVFVHSTDVTERKHRIQEVDRRNQRLESVARTLSHDLQSPLGVAEGRLELARETGEMTHLEEVAAAHNRMQNLINELLRLARDEGFELSTVGLEDVIEQAWAFAETADADLVVDIDGKPTLEADQSQLQRIFENLFENAVEHGDADTVSVGLRDDRQGIYIADDGSGITEDGLDIFESGISTAESGTGYGLAIVEQIALEHDWRVGVEEAGTGGARFELTGIESLRGTDDAT